MRIILERMRGDGRRGRGGRVRIEIAGQKKASGYGTATD